MRSQRLVKFQEFGRPEEVAKVCDDTIGEPEPGEILVRMRFAPINPADLNFMEGTYGIRPELPATAGTEGIGEVVEIGDGVGHVAPGDFVIVINRMGCWSTLVALAEGDWVKVPREVDLQQASMLKVNPLTAWCMLRTIRELQPGEFVIQNAANSGVGISVAQLAVEWGIPMIHFVRTEEAAEQVRQEAGAQHVFLDNEDGASAARAVLESKGSARLALNAVGGESALRLMALLEKNGTHVTYGAMSRSSLKVPNSFLIFRNLSLRGFWVTEWMKAQGAQRLEEVYAELSSLMLAKKLKTPIDHVYAMDEVADALEHASRGSRKGKVLLQLAES